MPEAVKEMLRLEPDVVVMDLMMPVKDGITATREILAARPETKILILTTSTVPADLAQAREAAVLSPEIAAAIDSCNALPDGVSVITITKHMESILAKLGAANRSEAITIAVRIGLLKV